MTFNDLNLPKVIIFLFIKHQHKLYITLMDEMWLDVEDRSKIKNAHPILSLNTFKAI